LGIERDVADLVDDQQRKALQPCELVIQAALALRVGQERDPFGRGLEGDAVAGEAGADAEGDGEVGLAGAGRVGVELLMLLIRCRSGCGLSPRRGSFAVSSLRCWAGGAGTGS
jgi:hypothetical protein